jgi:ArsR family transcriptional regulator
MKTNRRIEEAAAMAGLLSNPMRAEILSRLCDGPCIVGDLVDALGESQATVSKQLGVLREAGMLACRPDGRCREYALASRERTATVLEVLESLGLEAAATKAECRTRGSSRVAV